MRQTARVLIPFGLAMAGMTLWVLFRPRQDYVWKASVPLPATLNAPDREDYEPNFTPDGRFVLFTRGKAGHNADLYIAPWPLSKAGPNQICPLRSINTDYDEIDGMLGKDGYLYFYSDRPGGMGGYDLYAAPRLPDGGFGPAANLGPAINSEFNEYDPCLSPCGRFLFFSSNRHNAGSEDDYDLYVSLRQNGRWTTPKRLTALNTTRNEWEPMLDRRGRVLYFTSNRERTDPDGTLRHDYDLYASVFARGEWQPPRNLGERINTPQDELDPTLSPDGRDLLFVRVTREDGNYDVDIWRGVLHPVPLPPLVDPQKLPWHVLGMMGLVAALLVLLYILLVLWQRMNTFQKCLLCSFFVHGLAAWVFSLLFLEARRDHREIGELSFTLYTDIPETFDAESFVASLFDASIQPAAPQPEPSLSRALEIPEAVAEALEPDWSAQTFQPKTGLTPTPFRPPSPPELVSLSPLSEPDAPAVEPAPSTAPVAISEPPMQPDRTPPEIPRPPDQPTGPLLSHFHTPALPERPIPTSLSPSKMPALAEIALEEPDEKGPAAEREAQRQATLSQEPAFVDALTLSSDLPIARQTALTQVLPSPSSSTLFRPKPHRSLNISLSGTTTNPPPPLLAVLSSIEKHETINENIALPFTQNEEPKSPTIPSVDPIPSRVQLPSAPPSRVTPSHENSPVGPEWVAGRYLQKIAVRAGSSEQSPALANLPIHADSEAANDGGLPASESRTTRLEPLPPRVIQEPESLGTKHRPLLPSPPSPGREPLARESLRQAPNPPINSPLPLRGPVTGPTPRPASIRWGEIRNLGSTLNTDESEYEPNFTSDGRFLVFTRGQAGHNADLFLVAWSNEKGTSATPVPLWSVNTEHDEIDGCLAPDGWLYFYSDRPGGFGGYDLYRAPPLPTPGEGFGDAVNLGPVLNSPFFDYDPFVSRDGRLLFFSSNRHSQGSEEDYDLYVSSRQPDGSWGPPEPLPFNTRVNEWEPALSADGLSLYFSSNRKGGFGGYDLWVSHFRNGQWQTPINLGPEINTSADELDPALSEEGTWLIFASNREGGHGRFDLWSARRILTVSE